MTKNLNGGRGWLADAAADSVHAMDSAYGSLIPITSAGRTYAEQAEAYRKYLNGTGSLALPPGTSIHETGNACDFGSSAWSWLGVYNGLGWNGARANSFGWRRTVSTENWHFEHSGAGTAGGSSGGPSILAVQQWLNANRGAGLVEDGIDGPATQAAVKAYQTALGVEADGVWGAGTELAHRAAVGNYEQFGGPAWVKSIQNKLNRLNYGPLVEDGLDGPSTQSAVKRFQTDNGLTADGIAGPVTNNKMDEKLSAAPVGRNATDRPTVEIQKLVGASVLDGEYGPETTAKVIVWQKANGLEPDGVWGPASDAIGFPVTKPTEPTVPTTPPPATTSGTTVDISHWQPNFTVDVFKSWKNAGVTKVIIKQGGANNGVYADFKQSGDWSTQVANARAAGLLVDHYWFNGRGGSVGDQINKIMGTYDGIKIEATESMWWDVEGEGEMAAWSPAEVVEYAKALKAAGIPYDRQGIYLSSSPTRNADWTPVVELGLRLWVADYGLNNGQISSIPLVGYWKSVALFQYTSTGKLPGYTGNLDLNTHGDDVWTVYDLQVALNKALGTKLVTDGIPGSATTAAIKSFQSKNGLEADGIAGTLTLTKLGGKLPTSPTTPTTPEYPTTGRNATTRPTEDIQKLVGALPADGIYGPLTSQAVAKWQAGNGLDADGIWGPASDAKGFPGIPLPDPVVPAPDATYGKKLPQYPGATWADVSPNKSVRTDTVQYFVVHHAADTRDKQTQIDRFMVANDRNVSPNWFIGADGSVAEIVPPDSYRAWTTGAFDHKAVTVETQNTSGEPNWGISEESHEAIAKLVAWASKRYGFPINRTTVIGHREVPGVPATLCPGPSMDLDKIVARAQVLAVDPLPPVDPEEPTEPTDPKDEWIIVLPKDEAEALAGLLDSLRELLP